MSKGISVSEFADVRSEELRERDLHMLTELTRDEYRPELGEGEEFGTAERLSEKEHEAFGEMFSNLQAWEERKWGTAVRWEKLTTKQRSWAEAVCERLGIDMVPHRLRKPVPRGREVPLVLVLQNLPKKPPGRK